MNQMTINPDSFQRALALACLLSLLASGCAGLKFPTVHKIAIQQGNVITQQMINQLKPGMSKSQVQFVLGQAVVETSFDQDHWNYIYTIHRSGGKIFQRRLSLYFVDGHLDRFEGNFRPEDTASLDSGG